MEILYKRTYYSAVNDFLEFNAVLLAALSQEIECAVAARDEAVHAGADEDGRLHGAFLRRIARARMGFGRAWCGS